MHRKRCYNCWTSVKLLVNVSRRYNIKLKIFSLYISLYKFNVNFLFYCNENDCNDILWNKHRLYKTYILIYLYVLCLVGIDCDWLLKSIIIWRPDSKKYLFSISQWYQFEVISIIVVFQKCNLQLCTKFHVRFCAKIIVL